MQLSIKNIKRNINQLYLRWYVINNNHVALTKLLKKQALINDPLVDNSFLDVKPKIWQRASLLQTACILGYVEVARILLENGAKFRKSQDKEVKNDFKGLNPLHCMLLFSKEDTETELKILNLLIEKGVDIDDNADITITLKHHYSSSHHEIKRPNPLTLAITVGKTELFKRIAEASKNVGKDNGDGTTALFAAIFKDDTEAAILLLQKSDSVPQLFGTEAKYNLTRNAALETMYGISKMRYSHFVYVFRVIEKRLNSVIFYELLNNIIHGENIGNENAQKILFHLSSQFKKIFIPEDLIKAHIAYQSGNYEQAYKSFVNVKKLNSIPASVTFPEHIEIREPLEAGTSYPSLGRRVPNGGIPHPYIDIAESVEAADVRTFLFSPEIDTTQLLIQLDEDKCDIRLFLKRWRAHAAYKLAQMTEAGQGCKANQRNSLDLYIWALTQIVNAMTDKQSTHYHYASSNSIPRLQEELSRSDVPRHQLHSIRTFIYKDLTQLASQIISKLDNYIQDPNYSKELHKEIGAYYLSIKDIETSCKYYKLAGDDGYAEAGEILFKTENYEIAASEFQYGPACIALAIKKSENLGESYNLFLDAISTKNNPEVNEGINEIIHMVLPRAALQKPRLIKEFVDAIKNLMEKDSANETLYQSALKTVSEKYADLLKDKAPGSSAALFSDKQKSEITVAPDQSNNNVHANDM